MSGAGTQWMRFGAAIGRQRMDVDERLAPVELLEHRIEARIADPFIVIARHELDPVGLQHVERIGDLAQAALDIGHRQRREQSEAAGMIAHHLRRVIVAERARACDSARYRDAAAPAARATGWRSSRRAGPSPRWCARGSSSSRRERRRSRAASRGRPADSNGDAHRRAGSCSQVLPCAGRITPPPQPFPSRGEGVFSARQRRSLPLEGEGQGGGQRFAFAFGFAAAL